MPSARPSFPVSSEPNLRRLGVGGSSGGGRGDRPLRAQVVVTACLVLVLIAVPLYLLRRPSSGLDGAVTSAVATSSGLPMFTPDAGSEERVRLGPVQRVKCAASQGARGQEGALCDKLLFFEEALAKAIKDNVDCAPREAKQGTISYAMSIDFGKRALTVFPGQSGDWRGPQAKRAAQCVSRSLPTVDWDKLRHQYRYYLIAILATYPPAAANAGEPDFE